MRANTVEGFWGSTHPLARDLMRRCLNDTDNRVAANAALGLYQIGGPDGIEALRKSCALTPTPATASARHGLLRKPRSPRCCRTSKCWPKTAYRKYAGRPPRPSMFCGIPSGTAERTRPAGASVAGVPHARGTLRLRAFVADADENPLEICSAGSSPGLAGRAVLPTSRCGRRRKATDFITVCGWMRGPLPPGGSHQGA